jgi:hypothetical protein
VKLRLTFIFIGLGLDINATRISKRNKGLAKPIGIKVKEKTVQGSRRPVSCFEKETKRKKKSTYEYNNSLKAPQQYKTVSLVSHRKLSAAFVLPSYSEFVILEIENDVLKFKKYLKNM